MQFFNPIYVMLLLFGHKVLHLLQKNPNGIFFFQCQTSYTSLLVRDFKIHMTFDNTALENWFK